MPSCIINRLSHGLFHVVPHICPCYPYLTSPPISDFTTYIWPHPVHSGRYGWLGQIWTAVGQIWGPVWNNLVITYTYPTLGPVSDPGKIRSLEGKYKGRYGGRYDLHHKQYKVTFIDTFNISLPNHVYQILKHSSSLHYGKAFPNFGTIVFTVKNIHTSWIKMI